MQCKECNLNSNSIVLMQEMRAIDAWNYSALILLLPFVVRSDRRCYEAESSQGYPGDRLVTGDNGSETPWWEM